MAKVDGRDALDQSREMPGKMRLNGRASGVPIGVVTVALLFPLAGSFVCEDTPAVPLREPLAALTLKVRVSVTDSPAGSFGPVHVTDGPGEGFEQTQFAGFVEETNDVPTGVPMDTVGELAASGPAFVTTMV